MYNAWFTALHRTAARPAFLIYGKARREPAWRVLSVHATRRRDWDGGWPQPFFAGTAITWTDSVIACGWDFAAAVLAEQRERPATPDDPVCVLTGRMRDPARRAAAGVPDAPSYSEVLAHECGHSAQARRLSWLFLPKGAVFTLFREGDGWLHAFENDASEQGLFGGIVPGSVHPRLLPAG
ncbi:MAG: hypothetical protein ACRC33_31990 [Gemmataceae bacterium]